MRHYQCVRVPRWGGGGNSYTKPEGTRYGLITFVYTMANTNTLSSSDTDYDISNRKRKRSSKKVKSRFCHHCDKVVSLRTFFRHKTDCLNQEKDKSSNGHAKKMGYKSEEEHSSASSIGEYNTLPHT